VTVVSGSVSDTHGAENGCMSLAGLTTVTGTLTTTWKTSPQLSSGNSVTTVNSVEGSVAGNGLAKFNIPGTAGTASGTGSFSGTNGGAASMFSVLTGRSAALILSACNSKGLTSISVDHAKKAPNTNPTAAIFGLSLTDISGIEPAVPTRTGLRPRPRRVLGRAILRAAFPV
jgi:hypothetical protein